MKNEVDWFSFLPDDVVLDILKRLPDVFLRYKAKYVCRQWFNIITNMILLDHASFILQNSFGLCHVDVREERQGIELKDHNLDIHFLERIISWYNEFLVITNLTKRRNSLYLYNLITKEKSFLPQCQTSCGQHFTSKCAMALSFDRFKGIYKVIHLFMGPRIQCHILHLGRDIVSRISSKWKKIKVPYSYMDHKGKPVSVQVQGRYFHWDVKCSKYLISVDMIKEESIHVSLPESGDCNRLYYSIFEMGGFLGLIDGVSWDKTEIWILKDFQRIKWEKLQSIRYPNTSFRYPVCGVISKRYVIFMKLMPGNGMCSYDMKNGVLKALNIGTDYGDRFVVHSSAPTGIIATEEVLM